MYATTASDPKHSSYAIYYDKKLGTYLGDVYSVKWMENDDKVKDQELLICDKCHYFHKEYKKNPSIENFFGYFIIWLNRCNTLWHYSMDQMYCYINFNWKSQILYSLFCVDWNCVNW